MVRSRLHHGYLTATSRPHHSHITIASRFHRCNVAATRSGVSRRPASARVTTRRTRPRSAPTAIRARTARARGGRRGASSSRIISTASYMAKTRRAPRALRALRALRVLRALQAWRRQGAARPTIRSRAHVFDLRYISGGRAHDSAHATLLPPLAANLAPHLPACACHLMADEPVS